MVQSVEFKNWTEYDDWLIKNYENFCVVSIKDENGCVRADYMEKSEWEAGEKDKTRS